MSQAPTVIQSLASSGHNPGQQGSELPYNNKRPVLRKSGKHKSKEEPIDKEKNNLGLSEGTKKKKKNKKKSNIAKKKGTSLLISKTKDKKVSMAHDVDSEGEREWGHEEWEICGGSEDDNSEDQNSAGHTTVGEGEDEEVSHEPEGEGEGEEGGVQRLLRLYYSSSDGHPLEKSHQHNTLGEQEEKEKKSAAHGDENKKEKKKQVTIGDVRAKQIEIIENNSSSNEDEASSPMMGNVDSDTVAAIDSPKVKEQSTEEVVPAVCPVVVDPEANAKQRRMRRKVLEELVVTEDSYVNDLRLMAKYYLIPLKKMLSDDDLNSIFSNLPTLLHVNTEILAALQERVKVPNLTILTPIDGILSPRLQPSQIQPQPQTQPQAQPQPQPQPQIQTQTQDPTPTVSNETNSEPEDCLVADVFLKNADYLKLYTTYTIGQTEALEAVQKLRQRYAAFKVFLEVTQKKPQCRNLDLKAFLIKPVQRICKYPLLLRELLKYTDESHPDHEGLVAALAKVQAVAEHVDKHNRHAQNINKMLEIQQSLLGLKQRIMHPGREFVKEGNVLKTSAKRRGRHGRQTRLFLFNDILIIAKRSSKEKEEQPIASSTGTCYIFKDTLSLKLLSVQEVEDPLAFELVHIRQNKNNETWLITTKSPKEKEEWITAITDTKAELQRKTYQRLMAEANVAERRRSRSLSASSSFTSAIIQHKEEQREGSSIILPAHEADDKEDSRKVRLKIEHWSTGGSKIMRRTTADSNPSKSKPLNPQSLSEEDVASLQKDLDKNTVEALVDGAPKEKKAVKERRRSTCFTSLPNSIRRKNGDTLLDDPANSAEAPIPPEKAALTPEADNSPKNDTIPSSPSSAPPTPSLSSAPSTPPPSVPSTPPHSLSTSSTKPDELGSNSDVGIKPIPQQQRLLRKRSTSFDPSVRVFAELKPRKDHELAQKETEDGAKAKALPIPNISASEPDKPTISKLTPTKLKGGRQSSRSSGPSSPRFTNSSPSILSRGEENTSDTDLSKNLYSSTPEGKDKEEEVDVFTQLETLKKENALLAQRLQEANSSASASIDKLHAELEKERNKKKKWKTKYAELKRHGELQRKNSD
jgi:hypothetical protein